MAIFRLFRLKNLMIGIVALAVSEPSLSANSTIADVARATYGESISNPAPDSLVGQYIRETGAKSIIRQFLKAPPGSTLPPSELGAEKLVVAVSAKTWPQFQRLFSGKNYFYQVHTPQQGTLVVAFNGGQGSYANLSDRFQAHTFETLLIPILVSDSESERLTRYFQLGKISEEVTLYPWLLVDDQNQSYAPIDGWQGCTFWLGNIPMGDLLVDEYVYASGEHDLDGSKPNVQRLRPYTRRKNGALEGDLNTLARSVWKVPGHQQLADVLGLRLSNLRGEFANTGWVAYTLLGSASPDRNPVIFYYVENELQEINPNFDTKIEPRFIQ